MMINRLYHDGAGFLQPVLAGWAIAVAAAAHRDEAVLAISFIIIVHMYYGHLATTTFPVNTVMFTGKMLKNKYRQWFRREYDELMEKVEESKE